MFQSSVGCDLQLLVQCQHSYNRHIHFYAGGKLSGYGGIYRDRNDNNFRMDSNSVLAIAIGRGTEATSSQ